MSGWVMFVSACVCSRPREVSCCAGLRAGPGKGEPEPHPRCRVAGPTGNWDGPGGSAAHVLQRPLARA